MLIYVRVWPARQHRLGNLDMGSHHNAETEENQTESLKDPGLYSSIGCKMFPVCLRIQVVEVLNTHNVEKMKTQIMALRVKLPKSHFV